MNIRNCYLFKDQYFVTCNPQYRNYTVGKSWCVVCVLRIVDKFNKTQNTEKFLILSIYHC